MQHRCRNIPPPYLERLKIIVPLVEHDSDVLDIVVKSKHPVDERLDDALEMCHVGLVPSVRLVFYRDAKLPRAEQRHVDQVEICPVILGIPSVRQFVSIVILDESVEIRGVIQYYVQRNMKHVQHILAQLHFDGIDDVLIKVREMVSVRLGIQHRRFDGKDRGHKRVLEPCFKDIFGAWYWL